MNGCKRVKLVARTTATTGSPRATRTIWYWAEKLTVAMLGNKQAALIYRSLPAHVIWGKITLPPFSSPAIRN